MKNYKRNNQKYTKTYGNQNYSNFNYENYSSRKRRTKRIIGYVASVLSLALALVLGAYFLTDGFYSKNMTWWSMQAGYYCPADLTVYEAGENNALISRECYETEKSGKKLKIYLDPNVIDLKDRDFVTYTIIYYSGTDVVYHSNPVIPEYNSMLEDNPTQLIFDYTEIEGKESYIPGNAEGKKIDCVRIAVLYNRLGEKISLIKQGNFTKAIIMEYM